MSVMQKFPTKPGGPKLMGQAEIAARLGVSGTRVHQLAANPEFPLPADQLKIGRVWLAEDVEKWIAAHRKENTSG